MSIPNKLNLTLQTASSHHQVEAPHIPSATPAELLAQLNLLPPTLVFSRLTISPSTPALHGSVTLTDVAEHLAVAHDISPADFEVSWVDHETSARIKELGSWDALVKVRGLGGEEASVEVEVVREE